MLGARGLRLPPLCLAVSPDRVCVWLGTTRCSPGHRPRYFGCITGTAGSALPGAPSRRVSPRGPCVRECEHTGRQLSSCLRRMNRQQFCCHQRLPAPCDLGDRDVLEVLDVPQFPTADGTTLGDISAVPASPGCLSLSGDIAHRSGPVAFGLAWARKDTSMRTFPAVFLAMQGHGDSCGSSSYPCLPVPLLTGCTSDGAFSPASWVTTGFSAPCSGQSCLSWVGCASDMGLCAFCVPCIHKKTSWKWKKRSCVVLGGFLCCSVCRRGALSGVGSAGAGGGINQPLGSKGCLELRVSAQGLLPMLGSLQSLGSPSQLEQPAQSCGGPGRDTVLERVWLCSSDP